MYQCDSSSDVTFIIVSKTDTLSVIPFIVIPYGFLSKEYLQADLFLSLTNLELYNFSFYYIHHTH